MDAAAREGVSAAYSAAFIFAAAANTNCFIIKPVIW